MLPATGRERIVIDLSCRRKPDEADGPYYVVMDRWQRFTNMAVTKGTLDDLARSCAEFLVHGVDVEGKGCGIEDGLVQALGNWSPIPVTYAGGCRNLEDVERVRALGNGRVDVTIGSALDIFGGALPYLDVVAWDAAEAARTMGAPETAPGTEADRSTGAGDALRPVVGRQPEAAGDPTVGQDV